MGKKSRAKIQKQKQSAQKQVQQPRQVVHNSTLVEKLANQSNPDQGMKSAPRAMTSLDDYTYVASDIRRILTLISISVVVLVAAVVINSRTTLLITIGEKLTSLLGLGS